MRFLFFALHLEENIITCCWLHRKKYELLQFSTLDDQFCCPFPPPHNKNPSLSHCTSTDNGNQDKRNYEKLPTKNRIGSAFRNSWGRKDSDKSCKKGNSLVLSSSMVMITEMFNFLKFDMLKEHVILLHFFFSCIE